MKGNNHLSDGDIQATLDAMDRLRDQAAVARELGVNQSTVSRRLKRAAEEKVITPRGKFEVAPGLAIKGVSALCDAEGNVKQQWILTRPESHQFLIDALKEAFETYRSKSEFIEAPLNTLADLCSVYPIADQHLGLLAWGKETGDPYDLEIGKQRLLQSASRLIAQAPASEQAVILNLGDWTHINDAKNQTPAHHNILDVDSRYQKIILAGVLLFKQIVELALQKHQRVLIRVIPGNHDPEAAFTLTVAMMAFYENNPRVTVDASPGEFFWHRFGQTLIGAHHGHRMKPVDMALLLANHCREDWGQTLYRWFLFGHVHHEQVKEAGGVRVESFQTLASNDGHHHHSGYTSGKSITSVTLHREDGEIGRHRVNIPPPRGVLAQREAA